VQPSIPQPQHTQDAMTRRKDSYTPSMSYTSSMSADYPRGTFDHQPAYIHQQAVQTHHQPTYTHVPAYGYQQDLDWDQQLWYASQEDVERQWR